MRSIQLVQKWNYLYVGTILICTFDVQLWIVYIDLLLCVHYVCKISQDGAKSDRIEKNLVMILREYCKKFNFLPRI